MKSTYLVSSIAALCFLSGCQSNISVGTEGNIQAFVSMEVNNIEDAVAKGNGLTLMYLDKASDSKRKRGWLNIAGWALSTATTIAAGTEAHPDTIFLYSAAAQSVSGLEPIINFGGVDAPANAIASTRCVARAGNRAVADQVVSAAAANLKPYAAQAPEYGDAIRRFEGLKDKMLDRYIAAYRDYLTASTAPPIDVSNLPSGGSDDSDGAPPSPVQAVQPSPAQLSAWASLLNNASASIEAEINGC